MLKVVIAACKVKVIKLHWNTQFSADRLQGAYALGHHFFADTISWNNGNFGILNYFLCFHGGLRKGEIEGELDGVPGSTVMEFILQALLWGNRLPPLTDGAPNRIAPWLTFGNRV